jgi:erythromycin esterase
VRSGWIQANALRFDGVDPRAEHGDLEPLRELVGGARVVALGESSHGHREQFQFKDRVFRFLVEELGFTGLVFEAPFFDLFALDRYVTTGEGTAEDALTAARFWIWNTEEVLALAEWIRTWNVSCEPGRTVHVYGGFATSPTVGAIAIVEYLREVDPGLAAEVESALEPLSNDFTVVHYKELAPQARARARQTLAELPAFFDRNREAWEQATGRRAFLWNRLCATNLALAEIDCDPTPEYAAAFGSRDELAADCVAALLDLDGPGARLATWSHNGHAGYLRPLGRHAAHVPWGGSMRNVLGADAVVTVGFAVGAGTYSTSDAAYTSIHDAAVRPDPPPSDSLDATLAGLGIPCFGIDLRQPLPADVAQWLASGPLTRWFAGFDDYTNLEVDFHAGVQHIHHDIRELFDVLVFTHTTTSTRLLPTTSPRLWPPGTFYPPAELFERGPLLPALGAWSLTSTAPVDCEVEDDEGVVRLRRTFHAYRWGLAALVQRVDATAFRETDAVFEVTARAAVDGGLACIFIESDGFEDASHVQGWELPTHERLAYAGIEGEAWRQLEIGMTIPA